LAGRHGNEKRGRKKPSPRQWGRGIARVEGRKARAYRALYLKRKSMFFGPKVRRKELGKKGKKKAFISSKLKESGKNLRAFLQPCWGKRGRGEGHRTRRTD